MSAVPNPVRSSVAADPVAEVPEDERPDGPRQEPQEEDREHFQDAGGRVLLGKEQLGEHQCADGSVGEVVVPLDRRADSAREQHASHLAAVELTTCSSCHISSTPESTAAMRIAHTAHPLLSDGNRLSSA
jgi:hypothetical protein